MKKTKMRDEIFLKIKKDSELLEKIAKSDGIIKMAVYKLCAEKSRRLSEHAILKIIKKHTGWKDSEIFEEIN